jgi:hypothetical protein
LLLLTSVGPVVIIGICCAWDSLERVWVYFLEGFDLPAHPDAVTFLSVVTVICGLQHSSDNLVNFLISQNRLPDAARVVLFVDLVRLSLRGL